MIDSTGPKISSCAIVDLLSTSAKTVGSTNQPWSSPAGRPPPATRRAPSLRPLAMYPSTRSRCRSATSGPISVAGSSASPTGSDEAKAANVSTTSA